MCINYLNDKQSKFEWRLYFPVGLPGHVCQAHTDRHTNNEILKYNDYRQLWFLFNDIIDCIYCCDFSYFCFSLLFIFAGVPFLSLLLINCYTLKNFLLVTYKCIWRKSEICLPNWFEVKIILNVEI